MILSIDLSGNPSDFEINDLFSKVKQLLKINRNELRVLYKIPNIRMTEGIVAHLAATFQYNIKKRSFLIGNRRHEQVIDFLAKRHNALATTRVFNNIVDAFNYLATDERGWSNFRQYVPKDKPKSKPRPGPHMSGIYIKDSH